MARQRERERESEKSVQDLDVVLTKIINWKSATFHEVGDDDDDDDDICKRKRNESDKICRKT